MPNLSRYAKYITAAFSALLAVNGVFHFLPDPTLNQIGGLLGTLGLLAMPSVLPGMSGK